MEDQKITCPVCHEENQSEFRYCKHCGSLLHTGSESASPRELESASPMPEDTAAAVPPPPPNDGGRQESSYPGYTATGPQNYSGYAPPGNYPPPAGQAPPPYGYSGSQPQQNQTPPPGYGPPQGHQPYAPQQPYAAYPPYAAQPHPPYAAPYAPPVYAAPAISGIPSAEVAAFVGDNAGHFVNKFAAMEQSGSKGGWNWPVFLLSFFLGPVGTAIWFLRRKMYAIGSIFMLVFVVVTGIQLYFSAEYVKALTDWMLEIFYSSAEYGLQPFPDMAFTSTYIFVSLGVGLIDTALAVIMAIFANSIYKNHCVKKIVELKEQGANADTLRAKGGISPIWIIALILIIASIIVNVVVLVEPIFDAYGQMLSDGGFRGGFYS